FRTGEVHWYQELIAVLLPRGALQVFRGRSAGRMDARARRSRRRRARRGKRRGSWGNPGVGPVEATPAISGPVTIRGGPAEGPGRPAAVSPAPARPSL